MKRAKSGVTRSNSIGTLYNITATPQMIPAKELTPHGRANSGSWILNGLINLTKHMRFSSEFSLATIALRH